MFVWQLARQIGTHRGWPAADLTEVSHLRSCEHAQQGRFEECQSLGIRSRLARILAVRLATTPSFR